MVDNIKVVLILVMCALTALCFLTLIEEDEVNHKLIIGMVVTVLLLLVIPSKRVMYQMQIASFITPDNIELVQNSGKDLIDYIIKASREISTEQS